MANFPETPYFFFLDDHTVIANPLLSVEEHIVNKERLESLMITDVPVVPPDSVIKTFSHLKGDKVDLILSQDKDGLSHNSFILRRGEWAKYLLDAWFDPLYRSYNFQKAERHALEHIVQYVHFEIVWISLLTCRRWHGTILAKLALVPQNIMNSYSSKDTGAASANGIFKDKDFIINFGDCDDPARSCELEMRPWFKKAQKELNAKAEH
jgi:mannan polymerase II complex MNN11 subunit